MEKSLSKLSFYVSSKNQCNLQIKRQLNNYNLIDVSNFLVNLWFGSWNLECFVFYEINILILLVI